MNSTTVGPFLETEKIRRGQSYKERGARECEGRRLGICRQNEEEEMDEQHGGGGGGGAHVTGMAAAIFGVIYAIRFSDDWDTVAGVVLDPRCKVQDASQKSRARRKEGSSRSPFQ